MTTENAKKLIDELTEIYIKHKNNKEIKAYVQSVIYTLCRLTGEREIYKKLLKKFN